MCAEARFETLLHLIEGRRVGQAVPAQRGEECQDINTESLLKDEKFEKIKNRIKQILDA